jgi:hypothetical protein
MVDPNKKPQSYPLTTEKKPSIDLVINIAILTLGILAAVFITAAILAQVTSSKSDNGETIYVDIGAKKRPESPEGMLPPEIQNPAKQAARSPQETAHESPIPEKTPTLDSLVSIERHPHLTETRNSHTT